MRDDRLVFLMLSAKAFSTASKASSGDDFVVFIGDFTSSAPASIATSMIFVFVSLIAGDDEEARVMEHPAYAARSTEVAAGFGKFMANVSSGAVAVIQ